mgnify:CR=1 FL=1
MESVVSMSSMGNHLLVVGGTGFIGRWVIIKGLEHGYKVTSLSRRAPAKNDCLKEVTYLHADVSSRNDVKAILRRGKFTHVVNLCGAIDHSRFDSGGRVIIDSHFSGLLNLIECLNRLDLKCFIQIGSSDEYGDAQAPQNEGAHCKPISCYSFAKLAANDFLQMLNRVEDFPVIIVRLFLVFGPYQKPNRFLPHIISSCLKDEEFSVTSGEQLRDFCYVEDIVNGIFMALESSNCFGEIINMGSGNSVSIKSIVFRVVDMVRLGCPRLGSVPYREGENMNLVADISKANRLLKWEPNNNFYEDLQKTITYYTINNG